MTRNNSKVAANVFSAASHDLELVIAEEWSIGRDQTFAMVMGPMLEVSMLIISVKVALLSGFTLP